MNNIQKLFSEKDKNILSIYFTAGFPRLDDTGIILNSLRKNGADLIEIGMPYSDPLADGPVIQNSSMKALHNGMTIQTLFNQLHSLHENDSSKSTPLILMGYLNPVMQYGFEKFCREANNCGISGIILPDLPINEYENEYKKFFEDNDLSFIFLITPETSEERIRKIDSISNGFIYAVSSSSTTGKEKDMHGQQDYFHRLQQMNLKSPVLVGFGIKDRDTFEAACQFTNGAVIGTAFIKALQQEGDLNTHISSFIKQVRPL